MIPNYLHRITTKKEFKDNLYGLVKDYGIPEEPVEDCHDKTTVLNYITKLKPLLEHMCEEVSPKNKKSRPIYSQKDAALLADIMLYFAASAIEFVGDYPDDIRDLFKDTVVNAMMFSDKHTVRKTTLLARIPFSLKINDATEYLTRIQNEYLTRASISNIESIFPLITETWRVDDTFHTRNLEGQHPIKRRLIFEKTLKSIASEFDIDFEEYNLDVNLEVKFKDFLDYAIREREYIRDLMLGESIELLKLHAILAKAKDYIPAKDTHRIDNLLEKSVIFARDILKDKYETSMKAVSLLDMESSSHFWISTLIAPTLEESISNSGIEFN